VEKAQSWSFQSLDPHENENEQSIESLDQFNTVVSRIQNLKSLTWNAGPIPHSLLETLHNCHPKAVLKIFKFERFDNSLDHLDDSEVALSTYPTLTHLRAAGGNHSAIHSYSFAAFKAIVANSQSLHYAGVVLPDNRSHQADFSQTEEELLERNETNQKKCRSLNSLTLDGSELILSKDSLHQLDRYIEIRRLESLKFSRGLSEVTYFDNAATMLPNLKHVSLNFAAIPGSCCGVDGSQQPVLRAARRYLQECAPLQTLSLWAWNRVTNLRDLLARHGRTLTSLQLHEKEGATWTESDYVESRPDVRLTDVLLLQENCPSLRDLTIDMNHDRGEFDLQAETRISNLLDGLAQFQPQLRKLQIYFNSGGSFALLYPQLGIDVSSDDSNSSGDDRPVDDTDEEVTQQQTVRLGADSTTSLPWKRLRASAVKKQTDTTDPEMVLQHYVQSIWKRLYGGATAGERLLDVKFGEWESKIHHYYIRKDPRRYFELRPHERDDHVGECHIKMKKKG